MTRDGESGTDHGGEEEASPDYGEDLEASLEDLRGEVETLKRRVASVRGDRGSPGLEPGIFHKVIHACMDSERITEEEELRIIEELIG